MKHLFISILSFISAISFAQQTEFVDFQRAEVMLGVHPEEKSVHGLVRYDFSVLKKTDSIFIDAVNMKFNTMYLGNLKANYYNDGKKLWLIHNFEAGIEYTISFNYKAFPKKAMYFIGWEDEAPKQVWTQGQGKSTSNWLPSFDDANEKVEFDLIIQMNTNDYEVVSNGKIVNKSKPEKSPLYFWSFDMKQPMSSYLLALAIGKYDKKVEYSKSGIPLEMYYYPKDSLKVEPTYRYTRRMFDYLEEEIGVAYPWQNYKQVPVHDFLYAGMENTSMTIFSDAFMIDDVSFMDKNYVNVNAHELAHQWFGDLVTAVSGEHHWLQEGFATYYALLAEREVFGDQYYYWRLYEYTQELIQQDIAGHSTALLDPKSSSTTFYKKGALALYVLREKVGDRAFKKAVRSYLNKNLYSNVETKDFIAEVEQESEQDLSEFVTSWLNSKEFLAEETIDLLKKNSFFISEYMMADCEIINAKCDYFLTSGISVKAKAKIMSQVPDKITSEVFKTKSLEIRQAIAKNLSKIPLHLKTDYESLLLDKSYQTVETALYYLVANFPENAKSYLEQTKNIIGFSDKNVRQLWLFLAIATSQYSELENSDYLQELVDYTSSNYHFEVRQLAFSYLDALSFCDETCIENLRNAATHHNWRFKKFAKDLLETKQI